MNELMSVNYTQDEPTVSGRELHEFLEVKTKYKDWFPRMTEYGFIENQDYTLVAQKRATNNPKNPITDMMDHQITIPMAKELCMIQRSEKGKQARIAENSGVYWIFIDLEINGKDERQGHLDTVISRHDISDVKKIKDVLHGSKVLVRVNPIFAGSKDEIDRVIDDGADIVMLPFFKSKKEVEDFIGLVDKRAETMLLLETPEAVDIVDDILSVSGIDYIHIGLNDLHLGYGMKFMFELLADGTVESLCNKFRAKGITYGFGGIAKLGQGDLPAEYILAEHHRMGSSMVILSRSFCDVNKVSSLKEMETVFESGIKNNENLYIFFLT